MADSIGRGVAMDVSVGESFELLPAFGDIPRIVITVERKQGQITRLRVQADKSEVQLKRTSTEKRRPG